jgi:glycine cleavage system transcriptional repressor
MRRWFALSAIGLDRPGIVADLAELIYECDCNLEDSSMTILGPEFAVLLLLSGDGPSSSGACTPAASVSNGRSGSPCSSARSRATRTPAGGRPTVAMECEVNGVDKAGIVARVSRTLAEQA